MLTVLCAIIAVRCPYEFGYLRIGLHSPAAVGGFVLARIIDVLLLADVGINLAAPHRHADDTHWVYQGATRRYLRSWEFAVDVVAALPLDLFLLSAHHTAPAAARLLKLAKLPRHFLRSRVIARREDATKLSFALLALMKHLVMTAAIAHILACVWGAVGGATALGATSAFDDNSLGDATEAEMEQERCFKTLADDSCSWVLASGLRGAGDFALYCVSLFVALNNIFGGSSDIMPTNTAEAMLQSLMMAVGCGYWAFVVGDACAIAGAQLHRHALYRNLLDDVNFYCAARGLPSDLRVQLRAFLHATRRHVRIETSDDNFMSMVSPRLRDEVSLALAQRTLKRVASFAHPGIEIEFLSRAAVALQSAAFARRDFIPTENLTIVTRGIACKDGVLRTAHAVHGCCCWGEDMIVGSRQLRALAPAVALTVVVEVVVLEKRDLDELLREYPTARKCVRRAAARIALIRTMRLMMMKLLERRAEDSEKSISMKDLLAMAQGNNDAVPPPPPKPKRTADERLRRTEREVANVSARLAAVDGKLDKLLAAQVAGSVSSAVRQKRRPGRPAAAPVAAPPNGHPNGDFLPGGTSDAAPPARAAAPAGGILGRVGDHLVSDGPTRRRSMPTGSLWGRLRETVAAASAAAAAEGGSGVSRKATPEAGDPPLDPMEC